MLLFTIQTTLSHWLATWEAWFRSRDILCEIHGEQNGTGEIFFLPNISPYTCLYYATSSPYSFIYHQHYIIWHSCNKTLPSHLHNITTHNTINYIDIAVKTTTPTHKTHFHSHCSYTVAVTLSHDAENNNKLLSWW